MRAVLIIVLIFLVTQLFGLYLGIKAISLLKAGQIEPVVSNPNSLSNSILLFVYILLGTGIILLVLRYKKSALIYIENIAAFFLILTTFNFFLPLVTSIGLTLLLLFWTNKTPNTLNKNLCTVLSVVSAGALVGASIGIVPVLVFCLLITIYDFISVFITKHMVYLAREIIPKQNVFTVSTPFKGRKVLFNEKVQKIDFIALGSGDLFVPLMFSVSLLGAFGFKPAMLSTVISTVFLTLMYVVLVKKRTSKVLPALPIIFSGSLLGFALSLIW